MPSTSTAASVADLHIANDREADTEIRGGYPVRIAEELQDVLALTDAEMADVLGRSRRTYTRYRRQDKQLGLPESERIFRYIRLLQRAEHVFGTAEKAAWWMKEPNPSLNGRPPFDVALTAPGAALVDDLLAGLEHGFPV
ncbi:type II RES/Xre toxin-antitoxin system antitoxin [Salisaeta longa]|uniref:type II RES/Xre toxin-antitoxin system antitoxin n=1 Tax=Salisaeta longa TaxID=503170 RepID=UPI0003B62F10|nr:antitoxin Xre/MbcA/ParS toxin-binding domain-containing protein [Salisaeta longa]